MIISDRAFVITSHDPDTPLLPTFGIGIDMAGGSAGAIAAGAGGPLLGDALNLSPDGLSWDGLSWDGLSPDARSVRAQSPIATVLGARS